MQSKFKGTVLGFIGHAILAGLIVSFTLGIAAPWAITMFMKWIADNTEVDGKQMKFEGNGGSLFGNYIKWFLLCIVTLGIYGFWLPNKIIDWVVKNTHFVEA